MSLRTLLLQIPPRLVAVGIVTIIFLVALTLFLDRRDAAAAAHDVAVLQNGDLPGHWAADCSRPASQDNNHLTFIIDNDRPVYQVDFGSQDGTLTARLRNIQATGDQIAMVYTLPRYGFAHATYQKAGDRIRLITLATRDDYGAVWRGIVHDTAQPTPWLNRCGP